MTSAAELAHQDIERIALLGFQDWPIDKYGVRVSDAREERSVSFPENVYAKDDLSKEDFWSRIRIEIVYQALKTWGIEVLWELGGGDGRVSIPLYEKGIGVVSIEPFYSGCKKVAKHGIPIFQGTLAEVHPPNCSLKAIGFFDVLEHIENEADFLSAVHDSLTFGGIMILTVPAHRWLYSEHDTSLGHFRRYSKSELHWKLENSGFQVIQMHHLFSVLVLPALFLRRIPYLLGKRRGSEEILNSAENILKLPYLVDEILFKVCQMESRLRLRFGLSLFVIARKVASSDQSKDF